MRESWPESAKFKRPTGEDSDEVCFIRVVLDGGANDAGCASLCDAVGVRRHCGANEIPPVATPATGSVKVTLDLTAQTLELNVIFSGLTSDDVAAHIHCCTPFGANTGVATTLPAFNGFPLGVTGITTPFDQVYSLTDSTLYNPAFVTAHGGTTASAEAALVTGIEDEMTYFKG
jgi:hypothetical protein